MTTPRITLVSGAGATRLDVEHAINSDRFVVQSVPIYDPPYERVFAVSGTYGEEDAIAIVEFLVEKYGLTIEHTQCVKVGKV